MVYGFGRVDASGRLADRAITSALGWRTGDRLTIMGAAGVVVARCDPGGHGHHARQARRRNPGGVAPPLRELGLKVVQLLGKREADLTGEDADVMLRVVPLSRPRLFMPTR